MGTDPGEHLLAGNNSTFMILALYVLCVCVCVSAHAHVS